MDLKNNQLFLLFRSARPRQWVKNLAVFAALIFGGFLLNLNYLVLSLKSFFIFCLLSSAAYLINDLADFESDRLHPFKKLRPIASGKLNKRLALSAAILFLATAFIFSFFTLKKLFIMAFLFTLTQISYTFIFKKIPVIDALVIAGAYILRVYTGELITGTHLSVWLTLSVVSLALFLAIAKRRAELALLATDEGIPLAKTRVSLGRYKAPLLDIYLGLFATSTWITYGFYTFSEQQVLGEKRWFMLSVPFVLYGLMRYLQLIYEYGQGESPEKLLFMDKGLLLTVIGWGASVILTIYLI
jgi:4-hydroxybenzoate polyprenyltransferase